MATEVWFRNPHNYIRELVECGESRITWDRGLLVKRGIDPIKHADLYMAGMPYRVLTVGLQGTPEYRPGDTLDKPTAVYPTWGYGEDSLILEDFIENPMGQDRASCEDMSVPGDQRPVFGQEHRVVITDMPDTRTGPGRSFLRYLKGLQEEFPDCIIHIHGLYGWKPAFGFDFGAADVEPRTAAQKGKVHLPSGAEEKYERLTAKPQWAAALGFKPADLAVPRNRCMYNIKSALWAGQNYTELYKFKTRAQSTPTDYTSSDDDHTPETTRTPYSSPAKVHEGDKLLCNTCSLQDKCKYFRIGSVCTVPGAEPVRLSKMFKTRDADTIIDGLGTLLAANANRLETGMQHEQIDGDLSPEVSRMMGQVFDQGVKLAKLLEPQRFGGGAKVQVNVGPGGVGAVAAANPRQLVAAAIRELEQQGIPRENITTEMIQGVFEGMQNPDAGPRAIQGTIISSREEEAT